MTLLKTALSLGLAFTSLSLLPTVAGKVYIFPNELSNGTVTDETVSTTYSLDQPKLLSAANNNSYDWWYFDVVSTTSQNESVDITFYNAGPIGFPAGYNDGPLSVSVSGSFANGSLFNFQVPATLGLVFVQSNKLGVVGDWLGAGAGFTGSDLLRPNVVYTVEIDSPELGVFGSIILNSVAPASYGCSLDKPGVQEIVFNNVGWAVAIPDANAVVNLDVRGSQLSFTGLGYHDHNWGITPFAESAAHTYWGHARIGPFSLTWSDALVPVDGGNLTEKFSSAVSKDGKSVIVSCVQDAVVVRPWGTNDLYPPTVTTGPPQGLELVFDLGSEGVLRANITSQLVLVNAGFYQRFLGGVTAELNGEKFEGGRALYEQFKLIGA